MMLVVLIFSANSWKQISSFSQKAKLFIMNSSVCGSFSETVVPLQLLVVINLMFQPQHVIA